ncbi:LysR family transcriptional regulator [Oxalobacteraceae bacterium OM1]|nr:LysR family transcriptional regulator [Oxalobacteraceae bacterium OM1]
MNTPVNTMLPRPARQPQNRPKFTSRPHDVHNIYVSLKQWRILHAVIDCGGYAEAAKALHLSQSTISYTVSKLQEQLGLPLLRIEGRRAVLTAEGRALLERSRQVLKEAIELETLARSMGQGWGGEVRIVVDHNVPSALLMRALGQFHAAGQQAHARLREVSDLHPEEVLRDPNVDLVVGERVPLGFLGEPLMEIEYLPVAHPSHPLLSLGRDLNALDLAQHVLIGIRSGHPAEHGGYHERPLRRWTMSSFDSVLAAVLEGLGYAWLPRHRIEQWLAAGTLVPLSLNGKRSHPAMLYLIHGRPWSATPAAGRFAEILRGMALEDANRHGARH